MSTGSRLTRRRAAALVLAAALALAPATSIPAAASGAVTDASASIATAVTTASISGRLVDAAGNALPGLVVGMDLPRATGPYFTEQLKRTTTTDADGYFTLKQPASGKRFLLRIHDPVSTDDYRALQDDGRVLPTWIGSRAVQSHSRVAVPTGYRARASAIASGTHRLVAPGGFDVAVEGTSPTTTPTLSVLRRDGTTVAIAGVDDLTRGFIPGRYTIQAAAPGYFTSSQRVTLDAGELDSTTLSLSRAPVITGVATVDGVPSRGAVTLHGPDGRLLDTDRPDAAGRYDLRGVYERGRHTITSTKKSVLTGKSQTIDISTSSERVDVDLQMRRTSRTGVVSGTVRRAPGKGGTLVTLIPVGAPINGRGDTAERASTIVQNGEKFRLRALPGVYRLVLRSRLVQPERWLVTTVRVKARSTTAVGTVTPKHRADAALAATLVHADSGKPMHDEALLLAAATSKSRPTISERDENYTGATARLRLGELMGGRYSIRVWGAPVNSDVETPMYAYKSPYYWTASDKVRVRSGQTTRMGTIPVTLHGGFLP